MIDDLKHKQIIKPISKEQFDLYISPENHSERRQAAENEEDFVQILFRNIIPAIHCLHLYSKTLSQPEKNDLLGSTQMRGNFMCILLFLVQATMRQGRANCGFCQLPVLTKMIDVCNSSSDG